MLCAGEAHLKLNYFGFVFLIVAAFAFTELDYNTNEGSGFVAPIVELRSGILEFNFEVTIQTSPGTATGMHALDGRTKIMPSPILSPVMCACMY